MKERLQRILSEYGLSSSRLAEKLGVQRSGISHILSGRNKPGYDFLAGLLKVFPEIDANWLLSGKGSMYLEDGRSDTKGESRSELATSADLFTPSAKQDASPSAETDRAANDVHKSKQIDFSDDQVASVLILLKNGKFRSYNPE